MGVQLKKNKYFDAIQLRLFRQSDGEQIFRQTARQTARQTDRQTDRQTERLTDGQMIGRQTDI